MTVGGRGRHQEVEPINLTPLLDCILNLIFFFLLATTIKENIQVMEVQLPQTGVSATVQTLPKEIVVTIGKDGSIFYDNDAITSGQLKTRLAEAAKASEPVPLRIRGDQDVRLQTLVDVLSVFQETGYPKFRLDTKLIAGGPR